ncbi:MAG: glutamyl-tRNA reductase [Zetaproteobacteria bacterium]|nr:MAG: glutamyl-tRNA reductase [Zetaproteobacteria bacterium]
MRICHIGLNHKTTPITLRERLATPEAEIPEVLRRLVDHEAVREALLLSTCNRVEMTLVTHNPEAAIAIAHRWFADRAGVSLAAIQPHLYSYTTEQAVRHIFRVAAGLDSLVLGEPQILGQVKAAYDQALNAKTAGHILHRLYQSTFAAAKRARSETAIGRQSVNVAACAVELARQIFGDLENKTVMLLGAGEMAELAARHLYSHGCKHILVANRTLARAEALAAGFAGHALTLDQLGDFLDAADIVISSTSASTYVLMPHMIEAALDKRHGRPMLLLDIAVPRDIDPRIDEIDDVYLFDVDDLQQVADGNRSQRERESLQAAHLLDEEAARFFNWLKSLESVPLIRAIQQQSDAARREELAKAARHLKGLDEAQMQAVERFSIALTKRLLHPTLSALKHLPEDIEGDMLMGAARTLFDLHPVREESQGGDGRTRAAAGGRIAPAHPREGDERATPR